MITGVLLGCCRKGGFTARFITKSRLENYVASYIRFVDKDSMLIITYLSSSLNNFAKITTSWKVIAFVYFDLAVVELSCGCNPVIG